jgi:hypothetical protein
MTKQKGISPPIWDVADRISDTIVDLMNKEISKPDFSPTQLLAGQMLAMCALANTCPKSIAPPEYVDVMNAIQRCLNSMLDCESL